MSGHSKWATTKHRKGAQDKARAKVFAKLIRQVEVAAREGGGDLTANATLRTMYQKARDGLRAARHHRAGDQARHRRARGRALRGGHLRGLRARRRRGHRRDPDRQPQPHRRRDAQRLLEERRLDGRARRGRAGSSSARASSMFSKALDEDQLLEAALEAGAETCPTPASRGRSPASPPSSTTVRDALEAAGVTPDSAEPHARAHPDWCMSSDEAEAKKSCGSSTPSTTTTTSRTSTPTSTSPTRSWPLRGLIPPERPPGR